MEQDLGILWPAFLAGLLVLSTHVPLGQVVLKRGIIFIDIAVAQIAGMGVIAAEYFGWQADGWTVQIAAGLSALIGALLFNLCEKYWPEILEALIGIAFVLASSGSILLLAGNPHGGEHLKDLLVGQILWVGSDALKHTALLYAGILLGWFLLRRRIGRIGFYLLFALAITASVQAAGRRLSGLHQPDCAGAGRAQLPGELAVATGLRHRHCGLYGRLAAVVFLRPAHRRDHGLESGGGGEPGHVAGILAEPAEADATGLGVIAGLRRFCRDMVFLLAGGHETRRYGVSTATWYFCSAAGTYQCSLFQPMPAGAGSMPWMRLWNTGSE